MQEHPDVGLSTIEDAIVNWSFILAVAGLLTVALNLLVSIRNEQWVPLLHFLVGLALIIQYPVFQHALDVYWLHGTARRLHALVGAALGCLGLGLVFVFCRLAVAALLDPHPLLGLANPGGVVLTVGAFSVMPTVCCSLGWLSNRAYNFAMALILRP